MIQLEPIDRVDFHVIVDNMTDSLSSIRDHTETEFAYLARHGMTELSGDALCCACHGLSYMITARRQDRAHTFLFDSGPEAYAFERNCTRLDIDLGAVEAIVLSHGHWDHSGGMLKALDMIRARNGGERVPYYAHPDMFRSRARRMPNDRMMPQKDVPDVRTLTENGADVILTREPRVLEEAMFYVSGEIARLTPFERGLAAHFQRSEDGVGWTADPWLIDERFVAVNVTGKGLIVFTACSHAGVINVLRHAQASFPGIPLYALAGGFHLAGPNEQIIPDTVEAMKAFHLAVIAPGHCTGWRAMTALANSFGDSVVNPSAVGKRYSF